MLAQYEDHVSAVCRMQTEELDLLYSPSAWSKRLPREKVIQEHVRRVTDATARAKEKLKTSIGVKFDSSESHVTVVYSSESTPPDAPIFVYVHGGYWQDLSVHCSGFMAIPLVEAGAKVIAVGYDLAPKVSVDEILRQVQESIVSIVRMALKTKARSVYLGGHSAGAHLVARALDFKLKQKMNSISEDAADVIKGAFLYSGVYDLRPLTFTSENNALRMTLESAWHLSPINPTNLEQLTSLWHRVFFFVAVAEHDSPEFRYQSEQYHQLLSSSGLSTKYIDHPAVDHFDIVENLEDTNYDLTKEILDVLELNKDEKTTQKL